jgi:hypothetical protein
MTQLQQQFSPFGTRFRIQCALQKSLTANVALGSIFDRSSRFCASDYVRLAPKTDMTSGPGRNPWRSSQTDMPKDISDLAAKARLELGRRLETWVARQHALRVDRKESTNKNGCRCTR